MSPEKTDNEIKVTIIGDLESIPVSLEELDLIENHMGGIIEAMLLNEGNLQ